MRHDVRCIQYTPSEGPRAKHRVELSTKASMSELSVQEELRSEDKREMIDPAFGVDPESSSIVEDGSAVRR